MRKILFLLLITVCFFQCSTESDNASLDSKEYTLVSLKYAQHFRLKQKDAEFVLELINPDSRKVEQTVVLSKKNNERIICLTATLTGMFCELDQRKHLIGITAEDQLYDRKLKKKFQQGKLEAFGDFTQLSLERIADAAPDIILYNYVSSDFPNKEKLEKLGVKLLIVNDWLEAHPLAKAEWIKVIGAMTGKFEEACILFDKIESNYLEIATEVKDIEEKPTVISGNLIGDSWYAPSGENYFGILLKDAGGDYRYKHSKGLKSLALSLEKILEDNQHTEIWLNPGVMKKDPLLQLNPHSRLMPPMQTGEVYGYSHQGNKFWEQSALNADKVLDDLVHIFHPSLDTAYNYHYYSKLEK